MGNNSTAERIEVIRSWFHRLNVQGILFLDLNNMRYLTGFTGSEGAFFVGKDRACLLVDGRYTTQARREAPRVEIVSFTDKMRDIADLLASQRVLRIGFESSVITYDDYTILHNCLRSAELVPLSMELQGLRAIKDDEEIGCIKTAASIAARALTHTLAAVEAGVSEREIAALLESDMLREGSERPSFDTITASGENTALPHAHPGSRTLCRGDFVVIDYGAVYKGYHSDETCTIAVGTVTEEQRKIYNIVKDAHDRALDAVRPGIHCREIDAVARRHIDDAGYSSYFSHGTGHGVGLAVHESPVISSRSRSVLEQGMIITIEPGIYIPGLWGIRIEDMVLVTADGCKILTEMPKHLIIL